MTSDAKPRRSTTAQTVGVITVAASVIALSVVGTLTLSGNLDLASFGLGEGRGAAYQNITLTDAQLACEAEAGQKYGSRLKQMTLDARSSRFEASSNRYRMYFNLDMLPKRGKDKNVPIAYFLNCFVHAEKGRVTHFESVEDKEEGPKPIRQDEKGPWGF